MDALKSFVDKFTSSKPSALAGYTMDRHEAKRFAQAPIEILPYLLRCVGGVPLVA